MNLMSFSAYARHRGVSQPYISQMVKRGKIPLTDGKIDPVAADAALAIHADPDMIPVAQSHAARRTSPPAPAVPQAASEDETAPPLGSGRYVETPLSRAKTADAVYAAKTRKMEYGRAVGLLVELAEVDRALADLCGPAITALSGMADRLSARVAAEPDPRKCYALIDAEVDTARQSIADFARALTERLTATRQ